MPQDWKTKPLPERHVTINLNLSYSKSDKDQIIKGLIPKVMEEKWFVFFHQGVLNFHRSWTGYCIYRVYCHDDGDSFLLSHADVNRNPDQYNETSDEHDRHKIPALINTLLLQIPGWSAGCNKKIISSDFIRIIHTHRFCGLPAPVHRPYAFYADAESLKGLTIAECYSIVNGQSLPPEVVKSFSSPYLWNHAGYENGDYEAPVTEINVNKMNKIIFDELPIEKLEKENFVVLRVSVIDALINLDVFPATWTALSYIISDPERMGAPQLGWDMEPNEYATSRIHALFKEIHKKSGKDLLALTTSKEDLKLTDFDRLPELNEERESYHYLSWDSALTNKIVELFGIHSRCWHGCGYIGMPGEPICRFFLLRNIMDSSIKVSVMSGADILRV